MRHLALSAANRHRTPATPSRDHDLVVFGVVMAIQRANKRGACRRKKPVKLSNVARKLEGPNQTETAQHKGVTAISESLSLALPISPFQLPFCVARLRPRHKIGVVILFFPHPLAAFPTGPRPPKGTTTQASKPIVKGAREPCAHSFKYSRGSSLCSSLALTSLPQTFTLITLFCSLPAVFTVSLSVASSSSSRLSPHSLIKLNVCRSVAVQHVIRSPKHTRCNYDHSTRDKTIKMKYNTITLALGALAMGVTAQGVA